MRYAKSALALAALAALNACSSGEDAAPAAPAEPPAAAGNNEAPAAEEAGVFIVSPADGSTVTSPVTVEFGIRGYELAPAGTYEESTGHHHLLIDTEIPPLNAPIPADDNHVHFGKAQTSGVIELDPGEHTLQLLLGDGNHVPHSDALISEPVTITVVADAVE